MDKKKNREILEHFVEKPPEETPTPAEQPDQPEQQDHPDMDRKRYWAFLRYIAIMFVVAFIFVLLSFIVSHRDSQQTISQLNQNANSALARAEQLQDDNRTLNEANAALHEEVARLQEEVAAMEELTAALTEKEDIITGMEETIKTFQTENSSLTTKAEKTEQAYGYLTEAQLALLDGRTEDCEKALSDLQPLQEYLSDNGRTLYDRLLQELETTKEN